MTLPADLSRLSRDEKLALLARLARERRATPPPATEPDLRGGEGEYPLSFAQERLLFLHQLEGGANVHTQFRGLWLRGPLDRRALDRGLSEIARRHEALRTRFPAVGEERRQVVDPPAASVLDQVDLAGLTPEEARRRTEELAARRAAQPFDLEGMPPVRAALVRLGPGLNALLLGLHHIVSDGWSLGVFLRELAALYAAFAAGDPSPLPPPRAQLGPYSAWQRRRLEGEVLARELEFWRRHLEGAPARLELPADRARQGVVTPAGAIVEVELGAAASADLHRLARGEEATVFMLLLALWDVLLARHSGQRDLVVGLPAANRDRTELEDAVGCFASTLVQRLRLDLRWSFRRLLAAVRGEVAAILAHTDLPFERLVEELAPQRDLAHNPVFQVMFAVQQGGAGRFRLPGLEVEPLVVARAMANVDLTLELVDAGERAPFVGFLDYATDLFDRATVERLADHLRRLAESVAAAPDLPVGALAMLSPGERRQLLEDWTPAAAREERPVHERFAGQARRRPDALALVDGDRHLSFAALATRSHRLAHALRRVGVGAEVPVGICLERSAAQLEAMLAVLAAGGAYVPLDPAYPERRLALMIEESGMPLLLTTRALAERLPAADGGPRRWLVDEAPAVADEEVDGAPDFATPGPTADLDHLAYLIFTSGSTGRPKAVAVPHRGVTNHATAFVARFGLTPSDRFLHGASLCFDVAAEEIYPTWMAGAALVLLPPGPFPTFAELAHLIDARRITVVNLPTPFWHEWVAELVRTSTLPPAGLELVVVGTEQASADRLGDWLDAVGDRPRWVNAYGPTETTISATAYGPRSESWCGRGARVPIGRPIEGVRCFILDGFGEPVPVGVSGELFIAGAGVVRGYWRRPGLTAAAFRPLPFARRPGERSYATGDRARYRPDGGIEFLGRDDDQVKIRGFRIELGEIAEVLRSHPGVRECAVMVQEGAGGPRLAAYAAAAPGRRLAAEELAGFVAERLPAYMVPAVAVLAALPLTPGGKVDRRALAALPEEREEEAAVPPRGPLEEAVAAVWCEVLGRDRVGAHEDFFEIGGHSLLATRVIARLKRALEVDLSLPTFFESRTVASLATAVAAARAGGGRRAAPPIAPVSRDEELVCSFAQQRLWFLDRLMPGSPAANIPQLIRLEGAVDLAAMERAIATLVGRHETLRTTFAPAARGPLAGQPVEVVAPPPGRGGPPLPHPALVDLSGLRREGIEEVALGLAAAESVRPFDLSRGPLLRICWLRLAPEDLLLHTCTHHIVSDGVSVGIFVQELLTLYEAEVRGTPANLPELRVQYADFAAWQRSWLEGEVLEAQVEHWRRRLAGAPVALALPTDRPRPPLETARGARFYFRLDGDLVQGLGAVGRSRGATLFMTLAAAFAALLGRMAGQRDVVLGWPISGRNRAELERLIGFLSNILVLRTDLAGSPGFLALLERVRTVALEAYDFQELPFEQLVEELQPERNLAFNPIFQVFFVLHHRPPEPPRLPGVTVTLPSLDNGTSRLDLLLSLMESPYGLSGFFEYNTDLFDRTTVQRLVRRFHALLAAVTAAPDRPLETLPLLAAGERQQLVVEGNDTAAPFPDACIHELVAGQVRRTPGREAVAGAGGALTYGELEERAERLARRLRHLGVGTDEPVGVLMDRTPELVAALLGILQAGGAYLPLDPAFPEARLEGCLADSGARVLVTEPRLRYLLDEGDLEVVEVGSGGGEPAPDLPAGALPGGAPQSRPDPASLAYLIYTSGSTGRPKGVAVPHRGVVNFLASMARRPGLGEDDSLLAVTTVSFDIAALEIWGPLVTGGRAILADGETAADGRLLGAALGATGATVMQATPATWRQLLAAGWPGRAGLRLLAGGEALVGELAAALLPRGAGLSNLYGPTETTIWSALEPVAAGSEAATVPIGRPIANTEIHLLDRRGEAVAAGVVGELAIGGAGLVRGYHRRPALTAAAFVPDPFSAAPGARLYHTGDLARRLADGRVVFLGRRDHQVKVRGFRIELGEVEAVLSRHPAVAACAAAVWPEPAAGSGRTTGARLVAYYVAAPGQLASVGNLRAALRERLPEYMVPSLFIPLEELPLTPNGKVDRRALPPPDGSRPGVGERYEPPEGPVEEQLAAIWCEVLRLDRVGRRDRFFELGGHSLMATQVLSRVLGTFGVELPLRTLFESPTVAALAEVIVESELSRADGDLLAELLDRLEPSGGEAPAEPLAPAAGGRHQGVADG